VHIKLQLLANILDVLKTFLVVRTRTTDPDLDFVLDELRSNFAESADDTLECGGDVGEVGNTTTDEENLALRVNRGAEHEVQDSAGVVEGLGLGWSTRVFSVVGELIGEATAGNGIGVDDGSTTTSDQSPYTAIGVQDGKLERCTSLSIELGNVSLLFAHVTTERSWELHRWASIDVDLAI